MEFKGKLKDKVALVAGATRGAGRGIACMFGKAVVALACDKKVMRKSGQALVSGRLAVNMGSQTWMALNRSGLIERMATSVRNAQKRVTSLNDEEKQALERIFGYSVRYNRVSLKVIRFVGLNIIS